MDDLSNGLDHAKDAIMHQAIEQDTRALAVAKPQPVDYSKLIAVITFWKGVLNARLLALISLLGCLAGFGFTMYDPSPLRLTGMAIYAILCQLPVLWLFLRKG